jgi:hypothetical protein
MAAPAIPPIRPGLIGTGLVVGKPHRSKSHTLAGRHAVAVFTDRSAEQGERSSDRGGAGPARASPEAPQRPHRVPPRDPGAARTR